VGRPPKRTDAELPDCHPPSPEPTHVPLRCHRCGTPITRVYVHAKSITAKSPDGTTGAAMPLTTPIALCERCVSDGTSLRIDIELRRLLD